MLTQIIFCLTQPKFLSNSEFRRCSRRNRRKNPQKKHRLVVETQNRLQIELYIDKLFFWYNFQVWFSNRRARLRKQAQSCPSSAAYNAMGIPMGAGGYGGGGSQGSQPGGGGSQHQSSYTEPSPFSSAAVAAAAAAASSAAAGMFTNKICL